MTGATQTIPGYENPGPVKLPLGNLDPADEGDSEAEDGRSFDSESAYDDLLSNIDEEDEEGEQSHHERDAVFEKIKENLSRTQRSDSARSGLSSMSDGSDGPHVQISSQYTSIPYGIQARATYEHSNLNTDIMGVAYNGRMRQFVILDSKGITTWKRDLVDPRDLQFMVSKDLTPKTFQLDQAEDGSKPKTIGKKSRLTLKHRYFVRRALQYPKYEYRLISSIVYAPKYNCYFALGKDFSVKVLNRDFEETCSVNTDMRSVLYILFNPVKDELITGGVGGIKIWLFQQVAGRSFTELKPLANYELKLKDSLPNVGGSWVKRVELDFYLQHLYCCSDTDLHVYDLSGKMLFKFERAHTMSITGCCFSPVAKVLVTASVDSDVKVWSLTGGLVHTFRGHSRAVTGLLLHPETSSVLITSSLDGSVRMWSLDTMDLLYMIVVSADGVMWMGLTDDKLLYISTCRNITLWYLNNFYSFWSLARNPVTHLSLASCEEKTTRVLAVGEDSSVRIFTRSNRKNITTVLPPPDISALQKMLSVCYSREKNTAFLLITNREIWVYTTRTDPSCRIAIWDVHDLQLPYVSGDTSNLPPGVIIQPPSQTMTTQRATENGHGNEVIANCCSLCILNSTAMMWTDEGLCCPIRHTYLLLGMEDGRILFMDPVIKGQKYMELKACKDAIKDMRHDVDHSCLITLCRLKTLVMIQVWGLPQLDAMYELYCGPDITCYSRLGSSILTGHTSGQVNLHILEPMEDVGFQKSTQEPPYESVVDENKRSEHHASIVAMDSLAAMSIFVTCSSDGGIKVWDESKVLLTEVMLEESLSAGCFLNEMGDLLVGFKNHVFYIDHSRLCPAFKPPEVEMETWDQESVVYEDPRVLYEILNDDDDPVTLDNYLVPFDLEFDEDFLEGKTKIEQPKTAAEIMSEESDSETETDISLAPSSIYLSPAESIESLSMIDLTLGADYSTYDLKAQMKATMHQMVSKAKEEDKWKGIPPSRLYFKLRRVQIANAKISKHVHRKKPKGKKRRKHITIETSAYSDAEEKELEMELEKFLLPVFGDSPGCSPSITPPSGEASPRHSRQEFEEEFEEGETREEAIYKEATGFVPIEPDKASSPVVSERGSASTRTLTPETLSHRLTSPIPQSKQIPTKTQQLHSHRKNTLVYTNLKLKQKVIDLKAKKKPTTFLSVDTKTAKENRAASTVSSLKKVANVSRVSKKGSGNIAADKQDKLQPVTHLQSTQNQSMTGQSLGTSLRKSTSDTSELSTLPLANQNKTTRQQSNVTITETTAQRGSTLPLVTTSKPKKIKAVMQTQMNSLPPVTKSLPQSKMVGKSCATESLPEPTRSSTQRKVEFELDSNEDSSGRMRTSSISLKQSSEYALVLEDLKKELETDTKLKEQQAKEELENIKAIFEEFEAPVTDDKDSKQTSEVNDKLDVESVVDSGVGSSVWSESPTQIKRSNFAVTHIVAADTTDPITIPDKLSEKSESESSGSHVDSESGSESSRASPKKKKEKVSSPGLEDSDGEGGVGRRLGGKVVDVRGLMKKKRRVTSARAPSLTRKSSADHSHEDHDHGHDDKRSKRELKKKQGKDDRNRPPQGEAGKLGAGLAPNPPSMLGREREARKYSELNLAQQQGGELRRGSTVTDIDSAHSQVDGELADIDLIQEAQWATQAAIHGQPMTLPPQKDRHTARQADPRIQRMKDRRHMLGERDHALELKTPGIGSSPTEELEQMGSCGEEEGRSGETRETTVQTDESGAKKSAELKAITERKESEKDNRAKDLETLANVDANVPETQMQRAQRLGLKLETEKLGRADKASREHSLPKSIVRRSKLNIYIPQAERDHSPSTNTSYRGTPDSGIIEDTASALSVPTPHIIVIKSPSQSKTDLGGPDDPALRDGKDILSEEDKAEAMRRPASSFTGLRRGQLEGERLRAERPHTAHVRFKAEDLQVAFEDALKRYETLPGTPDVVSADTLYKNDGTNFEDNWQQRVIERHTLLRLQKEIRAQSAAQRRQAIEVIKQDKQSTKLFTSRCESAIGQFAEAETPTPIPSVVRANTSMSVPITYGYGYNATPTPSREKVRPKTAAPALEKQQIMKSELSQEKPFRFKLNKSAPAVSRPASSRTISSVADFSPHWIDPRNPNAWRPKSSRSIPSKCNRYVLVNKPKDKHAAPVPSPLEEQLLVERFPKMGAKVVHPLHDPPNTPRMKKAFNLEYSPFVYQRYS